MDSVNMCLTVHRVNDPDQNILIDQHWEVYDPILSCSNQDVLPSYFFNHPDELATHFRVWDSGLPLCIVPQVHHFPEIIV